MPEEVQVRGDGLGGAAPTSGTRAPEAFGPVFFTTRYPALDGLRALAVLLVFVSHFGGGLHGNLLLRFVGHVRERGWIGVDLFFVISGFLITGILHDTRNDPAFFRKFYARRALRIFPVFYVTALVLLALTPLFQWHWRPLQGLFLVYLGNLPATRDFSLYVVTSARTSVLTLFLGHLSSLCVEEHFYLLWPCWYGWRVPGSASSLWRRALPCWNSRCVRRLSRRTASGWRRTSSSATCRFGQTP